MNGECGGDVVVSRWSGHPGCVGRARAQLRKALAGWGLTAVEDSALLVLSELLTNAVCHTYTAPEREIETRCTRSSGGLRIEVVDAGEGRPVPGAPEADATGGRGLWLVDALADRWGVTEREGPGKVVWAELSVVPDTGLRGKGAAEVSSRADVPT
ncbi:ATP-binding protein [Streptomyces sp. NPDC051018]|uniref:ATP-binding protein n=1 Tax=Streptomyces sp. NPDC051018 TaxID=3365639 RepID=UPI00379F1AB3